MNFKFLACALAASVTMSLQAVTIVNETGDTCYLFNFVSSLGDDDVDEYLLLQPNTKIEIERIKSFCFQATSYVFSAQTVNWLRKPGVMAGNDQPWFDDWLAFLSAQHDIKNVDDSMIVTLKLMCSFDKSGLKWGAVPYKIISKKMPKKS